MLDIGCGAGRNAVSLAELGWDVIGTDLSWPMLQAAAERTVRGRLRLALAPMDRLPIRDRSVDFVVAHGIWNLARSGDEFRRGIAEAARVSRSGGALFVFTFSRTRFHPRRSPSRARVSSTQISLDTRNVSSRLNSCSKSCTGQVSVPMHVAAP